MSDPRGLEIARRLIAEEAKKRTGSLDLGYLGLTDFPAEIAELTHLRRLSLGGGHYPGLFTISKRKGPVVRISC